MNSLDYAILAVPTISLFFALWHGFIHQAISLAGWVAALLGAKILAPELAPHISFLEKPEYQLIASYIIITLVVLISSKVLAKVFSGLIKIVGLGFLDRALGLIFGVLRGIVILVLLVALASLTSLKEHELWQTSVFMPHLEKMRDLGADYLEEFTKQAQEQVKQE